MQCGEKVLLSTGLPQSFTLHAEDPEGCPTPIGVYIYYT